MTDYCQRCNTSEFLNPLYENRLCMSCFEDLIDRTGGAQLESFIQMHTPTSMHEMARDFAAANSLLSLCQPEPEPAPDATTVEVYAQVDAQRQKWRDFSDWIKEIVETIPPGQAFLEIGLVAIEMRRLFRNYLSQPDAPRNWTELEKDSPGASIIWLTWFEVWSTGVLTTVNPLTPDVGDADAANAMIRAMVATPPLLIGARTELALWTEAVMLSGWTVANISLQKNRRLKGLLEACRKLHPGDMASIYSLLCQTADEVMRNVWQGREWKTPRELRTAVAREMEHVLNTRKDEAYHQKVGQDAEGIDCGEAPFTNSLEVIELANEWFRRAGLTQYQREVVQLTLDDFSAKEIAERLNRTESGVKMALKDARTKLRDVYNLPELKRLLS